VLLAVPLTASVVVIGRHLVASYRGSELYRVAPLRDTEPDDKAPPA
jgi:hypothetical protein